MECLNAFTTVLEVVDSGIISPNELTVSLQKKRKKDRKSEKVKREMTERDKLTKLPQIHYQHRLKTFS